MPYKNEWVRPEVFLTHNDIKIFHIYKHDNSEDTIRYYSYGYHEECSDDGDYSFDVRDLPNWNKDEEPPYREYEEWESYIKTVIIQAIELGYISEIGGNE